MECNYSILRNGGSGSVFVPFLPSHGRTLASGETFAVFGDIRSWVQKWNGAYDERMQEAFERMLDPDTGDLELLSTPAQIFQDLDTDLPKMLTIDAGTVVVADPCWLVEDSVSP